MQGRRRASLESSVLIAQWNVGAGASGCPRLYVACVLLCDLVLVTPLTIGAPFLC